MRISDLNTRPIGRYIPELYGLVEFRVLSALSDPNPVRPRASMFFVGNTFYRSGVEFKKALGYFDTYCKWVLYDRKKTEYYLGRIYHINTIGGTSNFDTHSCRLTPNQVLDKFFSEAKPWIVNPPSNIRDAAYYYYSIGAHPIPVKEGKLPAVAWKEWQEVKPPLSRLDKWDWNKGLIILGTDKHCFLDIDIKSNVHEDGLENFDEARLKGWCYEKSKNGGYHVFGLGKIRTVMTKGVELRGKGKYIVTYPTEGYRLV